MVVSDNLSVMKYAWVVNFLEALFSGQLLFLNRRGCSLSCRENPYEFTEIVQPF